MMKILIKYINIIFTETALKVTKPLSDTAIFEKESVTLTCEVNRSNVKAIWHKDGNLLTPSEHVQVTAKETVHTLNVKDSVLDDGAVYRCYLGNLETSATLLVKGTLVGRMKLLARFRDQSIITGELGPVYFKKLKKKYYPISAEIEKVKVL